MWILRRRRSVSVAPVEPWPAGAQEVTTAPDAANADCGDREASLRPGPQPSPGAMPPGSTMAAIAERGRLIVGVDQNTYPVRLPRSRLRAAGGLRHRPRPRDRAGASSAIPTASSCRWSMRANENRRCSRVRWTWWSGPTRSPVNANRIVDFSTVYFYANQKILAVKGSRNRFCRRSFRQTGVRGVGHDVAVGGVRHSTRGRR